ncbi:TIM barrel protein [Klebsiella indica]|uniref:sugar phosphate isomerase/epimerase family protein n=1 Tax=Klebsiella TaxID=570 RepID=UPI0031B67963
MTIHIANAPCSWGVDDPKTPYLPSWEKVLTEASKAGYKSIELGPWTYLPTDPKKLTEELNRYDLSIVAGTIFDDLVSESNFANIVELTHNICRNLSKIPTAEKSHGANYPAPYLVVIDFGNPERAKYAGHSDKAPRLSTTDWNRMVEHIKHISTLAWNEYGVRAVIHPHAGGCIEFADEIIQIEKDIPHDIAGLCLDTGHLYYSGMDPVTWLERYFSRLDYIHFKDVNGDVHKNVLEKGLDFFASCAEGVMCPIGKGAIDYPAVKALLSRLNYQGWITIEQERDPRQAEGSLHDVTQSLVYLKSVGF